MTKKQEEKVYSYKENTLAFNVDAATAGKAIEEFTEKHNGQCNPDVLVDEAKDENHPLHSVFDWDDASEAKKHRVQIARQLIGAITVTFKHYEGTRAFVSVKVGNVTDDKEKRTYVPVKEAAKPDYELQIREEASNWLKVFARRYQIHDYLSTEVQQVKLLIDKMEKDIECIKR
jgi:hypothetical protein